MMLAEVASTGTPTALLKAPHVLPTNLSAMAWARQSITGVLISELTSTESPLDRSSKTKAEWLPVQC